MIHRASAEIDVEVPADAQVGDQFRICGDARIVLIRDPQVDITRLGGPVETVPGPREYEFLVLNGRLEPK